MTMGREYKYPVWATQGGGLVREVNGTFIFVTKPDHHDLGVGDEMPNEWGIEPANQLARETLPGNPFNPGSLEHGLFEALGTLQRCPDCDEMLDVSDHQRHEMLGCRNSNN